MLKPAALAANALPLRPVKRQRSCYGVLLILCSGGCCGGFEPWLRDVLSCWLRAMSSARRVVMLASNHVSTSFSSSSSSMDGPRTFISPYRCLQKKDTTVVDRRSRDFFKFFREFFQVFGILQSFRKIADVFRCVRMRSDRKNAQKREKNDEKNEKFEVRLK